MKIQIVNDKGIAQDLKYYAIHFDDEDKPFVTEFDSTAKINGLEVVIHG